MLEAAWPQVNDITVSEIAASLQFFASEPDRLRMFAMIRPKAKRFTSGEVVTLLGLFSEEHAPEIIEILFPDTKHSTPMAVVGQSRS
jgi:proline racemase